MKTLLKIWWFFLDRCIGWDTGLNSEAFAWAAASFKSATGGATSATIPAEDIIWFTED